MNDLTDIPAISEDARLSQLIAEGIPNMVWTAAPDGALEFLNSRVFEYTGLDAEALEGWGWRAVIHAEDWEHCERTWRRSLAGGEPYRIEYRIRRGADGAYRWHIGAALPLRNPDGSVAKWFGTCTDIEDQKRAAELIRTRQDSLEALADERLREARERERELNEAQRLARIGSWEWDLATQETRWSIEMFRIFGRDPARGAPESARHPDLFTEESWARVYAAGQHALATGKGYELELEARLPGGATRWTLSRGECECDAGGAVVRLRGTVQDITERRAAERALRESEQRFQLFMDNNPAIAWIKDSRHRLVYVSAQYEKALGLSLAAVAGRQDFEIWPPAVAARVRRRDEEVLRAGAPVTHSESRPNAAGVEAQWLVVRFPLPDASGAPGVAGMAIDITKRHRLEQELRERDAQASLAMETAQMAHWAWRAADRRVVHSEGMGPLFGLPRDALLQTAKDWIALIHPEDRNAYLDAMRAAFKSRGPLRLDWRTRKPDGGIAWLLTSARTVSDEHGEPTGMVGVVMDITERRAAQHGLQRYSDRVRALLHRLVEAQEAERRRLATALHDLIGQNLTALNLGLDILRTDLHASANSLIGTRIGSMTRTVGETVDAIRGVMAELHPAVLDDYGLVPALHAHADRFRVLTGIPVGIEAPPDLPRLARPAELALYRIVQEALTNVAKHSGATRALVRIGREGGRFSLWVEDDGRGFSEPEGARASARGGWGLSEMRERAEALGGTLSIRFPSGGGTCVLVQLEAAGAD